MPNFSAFPSRTTNALVSTLQMATLVLEQDDSVQQIEASANMTKVDVETGYGSFPFPLQQLLN